MRDLKSPALIQLKAALLLAAGTLACAMLWIDRPTLKTALLLAIAIWSWCRAYYFAFYVIERYVDPGFRYSGLLACGRYLLSGRRSTSE
jgi:hypothetical protein